MIKKISFAFMLVLFCCAGYAQVCSEFVGETNLESFYNDTGNKNCKAILTNGKCVRLPPSPNCPAGAIIQLDEQQSAAALAQNKAQKKKDIEYTKKLIERTQLIDMCNAYAANRNLCATAGNYDQCMNIRFGNNHKSMPSRCAIR